MPNETKFRQKFIGLLINKMKIIEIILIFAIVVFLFFLSKPFQNTTECLALNPMFPTYDLIVISNSMNSNEIYILPMDPTNTYLFMKNGNTYGSFYVNFQLNLGIPILSIVTETTIYSILSTMENLSSTTNNQPLPFANFSITSEMNVLRVTDNFMFENKYVMGFDNVSATKLCIQLVNDKNNQIIFDFGSVVPEQTTQNPTNPNLHNIVSVDLITFSNHSTEKSYSVQETEYGEIVLGQTSFKYVSCYQNKTESPFGRILMSNNFSIDGSSDQTFLYFIGNHSTIVFNAVNHLTPGFLKLWNFKSNDVNQFGTFSTIEKDGSFLLNQVLPVGSLFKSKPLLYQSNTEASQTQDNTNLFNIDRIIIQSITTQNCIEIFVCNPYCSPQSCSNPYGAYNGGLMIRSILQQNGEYVANPNGVKTIFMNLNTGGTFNIVDEFISYSKEKYFVAYDSTVNTDNVNVLKTGIITNISPLSNNIPIETLNNPINTITCTNGINFNNSCGLQITEYGNLMIVNNNNHIIVDIMLKNDSSEPMTFTNNLSINEETFTNKLESIQFSNKMSLAVSSGNFQLNGTSSFIDLLGQQPNPSFFKITNKFTNASVSNIQL